VKHIFLVVRLLIFLSLYRTAIAQTTVTTNGGAANTVPVFTGTSSVSSSVITQVNGKVGIGTGSPAQALTVAGGAIGLDNSQAIQWQDSNGNTHQTIWLDGSNNLHITAVDNGVVTIDNNGGWAGVQFSGQTIGGSFGPGGNLSLQANSATDTTATGGSIFLGGSQRGDGVRGKVVLNGTPPTNGPYTTSGVVVNSSDNVGIGIDPNNDPAARLEVNGNIKFSQGSGGALVFQDNATLTSVNNTVWLNSGIPAPGSNGLVVLGNVGIGTGISNGLLNFNANQQTTVISTTRSDNTQPGTLSFDGWGNYL
jgi:hypothetical protein